MEELDTPNPRISAVTIADAVNALSMVTFAQASDPRGKLFGITGLLQPNLAFILNHTLSTVRACIGFIGHYLLSSNTPQVFLHPGPRNTGPYPSWVPRPGDSEEGWRKITPDMGAVWRKLIKEDAALRWPDANRIHVRLLTKR